MGEAFPPETVKSAVVPLRIAEAVFGLITLALVGRFVEQLHSQYALKPDGVVAFLLFCVCICVLREII
jgi:hypothetical protein